MSDDKIVPAQKQAPGRKQRSSAETTRLAVALVSGGVIAIFAILNTEKVQVDWILGSAQTPLILVIVICVVLGMGAGYVAGRRRSRRRDRD